jgi:ribosomal protein S18 acetylase RimI-like enzyme
MDPDSKAACFMMIRKGKRTDIPAILSILRAAVRDMEAEGIFQWDDLYPNETIVSLDINEETLWVYEDAGVLKAIITFNEFQDKEYEAISWLCHDGPNMVIHRLCVAPVFKGQGIGSLLVSFAEDHAKTNGYASIRLDAFSQNRRSLDLYERMGYIRLGSVIFRKGTFFCFEKPLCATM